jgi:hypothetical protein
VDIAKLILEYLTLALSWPVVLGALVLYFLKRHGPAVNNILIRVNSLSFPGGVTVGTAPYPADPTVTTPPKPDSGVRLSPREADPLEQLGKDFSGFLWQGIALNRVAIGLEIDRLWAQLMGGAFPLTILPGSEAKTQSDKVKAMKDIYKIDERAIKDFDFLEGLTKDTPRSVLVLAYNKAHSLKSYLSNIAPKFWKT